MENTNQHFPKSSPKPEPLTKSQKSKLRDQRLKETNIEEWERRRDLRNEKRRERRLKLKTENPEEYQSKVEVESKKRQERRTQFVDENPEEYAAFLESQRDKLRDEKIKRLHELYDSQYEKYKSTFPTRVSKNQWESLKEWEIKTLFKELDSKDITIPFLMEHRQDCLDFLRKKPDIPCGGSLIFLH